MTVIYSSEKIDGLSGEYRNPAFFAGPIRGAKLVYTDHNPIKEAYLVRGVEVRELKETKQKRRNSKGSIKKINSEENNG